MWTPRLTVRRLLLVTTVSAVLFVFIGLAIRNRQPWAIAIAVSIVMGLALFLAYMATYGVALLLAESRGSRHVAMSRHAASARPAHSLSEVLDELAADEPPSPPPGGAPREVPW